MFVLTLLVMIAQIISDSWNFSAAGSNLWPITLVSLFLVWGPKAGAFIYLLRDRTILRKRLIYFKINLVTCIIQAILTLISSIVEALMI